MKPTLDDINEAFKRLHAALDPLTQGEVTAAVEDARLAMQSLHLLRQWARRAARSDRKIIGVNPPPAAERRPSPPPPPPPLLERSTKRKKP